MNYEEYNKYYKKIKDTLKDLDKKEKIKILDSIIFQIERTEI